MSDIEHSFYEEAQVSEPTIIDTAVADAAGTVVKDLEPAAITAFDDLKAFVHAQADRLRTVLPALEQAAIDHVHGVVSGVLVEYDKVLGRIDAHLGGAPTGTALAPGDTGTVSNPAVPGEPVAAPIVETPVTSTPSTAPDPVEPVTGMAPAAGDGTATAETTDAPTPAV